MIVRLVAGEQLLHVRGGVHSCVHVQRADATVVSQQNIRVQSAHDNCQYVINVCELYAAGVCVYCMLMSLCCTAVNKVKITACKDPPS